MNGGARDVDYFADTPVLHLYRHRTRRALRLNKHETDRVQPCLLHE
jgi:hypothetical protein